jgi:hypothetical protein
MRVIQVTVLSLSLLVSSFAQAAERFVTEVAFLQNRGKQTSLVPQTLAQLRQHGVTEETELPLEFYFYTDAEPKAAKLTAALKEKGYAAEHKPAPHNRHLRVIAGSASPMKMQDRVVIAWAREMCELGYASDCEFDGWAAKLKQQGSVKHSEPRR